MQPSLHLLSVLGVGAGLGLVSTLGIYFDPRAGGKTQVICAGTIRGFLTALLVASTVPAWTGSLMAAMFGAIYGWVIALMIVLSHGKDARSHVLYVLPPSIVAGAVIGAVVVHLP